MCCKESSVQGIYRDRIMMSEGLDVVRRAVSRGYNVIG